MSSLGKLQEKLLLSSLCEVTAKCNLQDIPDLLVLHSVKLFDINNPQLPQGKWSLVALPCLASLASLVFIH